MRAPTIVLASLVSLAAVSTGHAQSYYCDRPSKPAIPSWSYSEPEQMEKAKEDVDQYLRDIKQYKDCLKNESHETADEAQRIVREWNDTLSNYNKRMR